MMEFSRERFGLEIIAWRERQLTASGVEFPAFFCIRHYLYDMARDAQKPYGFFL
jgi:hypothetical protein